MRTVPCFRLFSPLSLLMLFTTCFNSLLAQSRTALDLNLYETRCKVERATDDAERVAAQRLSSIRLRAAKRSWTFLWAFLNAKSTTYAERLAASYQGGGLVPAEAYPTVWVALADAIATDHTQPAACESLHGVRYGVLTVNAPEYPGTDESRAKASLSWQMKRVLRVLLDRASEAFSNDPKRYEEMSEVAWKWRPANYAQAYQRWHSFRRGPRSISRLRNIVRLSLSDEAIGSAAPQDLYVYRGDTYHYEELTHAAQVLILTKTKDQRVAEQAAYWISRLAVDRLSDYSDVLKPLRTNTGLLAIARWASDSTLDDWTRYCFAGLLVKMVDDPPFVFEPGLDPQSPNVLAALNRFADWCRTALGPIERAAAAEREQFKRLIAELAVDKTWQIP